MEKDKNSISLKFEPITVNNVNQLKVLNNMSLPVRYSEQFYEFIRRGLRFGKYAYINGIIVGAITWKYNVCQDEKSIYIMTINVIDAFKGKGIGSKLLQHMISIHKEVKEIKLIHLHVQESNQTALKFYQKNNFETEKHIPEYYTRLYPRGAFYLKLKTN